MFWFGEPWPSAELRASVCEEDKYRIPTPVSAACLLCNEVIIYGERGIRYGFVIDVDVTTGKPKSNNTAPYAHIECQLRSVMGNLIHVSGNCRHLGDCNERSDMTYREEALELWKEFRAGNV